ncbi:Alpha/beta knot methyltransferase [Chytriomyces sp. MP71]|nr:Alpha/beta knot methyltransferase [Chytriomyces sp. MP71]
MIVVLEQASLETGKGKEDHYELLNGDDHHHLLKKHNRDISESRPDRFLPIPASRRIRMLTALDTQIRKCPRHKLSIRSVSGPKKLLKIIKNPITDHLLPNARKITMSSDSAVVKCSDYVKTLPKDQPVYTSAHGDDHRVHDIVDEKISISEYPLSASVTCGKLTCALEDMWGVLYRFLS